MLKKFLSIILLVFVMVAGAFGPAISYSDEIVYVDNCCAPTTCCNPVTYCAPVPCTKTVYKRICINGIAEYNRAIDRFNRAIEKFNCASARFAEKNRCTPCEVSYYPRVERYAHICDPGYVVAEKINVCAPTQCCNSVSSCCDMPSITAVVNASCLNVRARATKTSMVIARLSRCDRVEILSKCRKNGYYKIMIPCTSTIGWVYGDYLSF